MEERMRGREGEKKREREWGGGRKGDGELHGMYTVHIVAPTFSNIVATTYTHTYPLSS